MSEEKKIEIDLSSILSFLGINIPSLPSNEGEIPKKINTIKSKGTIVNKNTLEPIPNARIVSPLGKITKTDKEGNFEISVPDIGKYNLPVNKFSFNVISTKYSSVKLIPYNSVGEVKPNMGIISMPPLESNLVKEISKFFTFNDEETKAYSTVEVTFEFYAQKNINKCIKNLKKIVIPSVILLISKYGISKIEEILDKDKQKLTDLALSQITCPTRDELNKIIKSKNNLVKQISTSLNIIKRTNSIISTSEKILLGANITFQILKNLPTPTVIFGVPLTVSVINGIQDVKQYLSKVISRAHQVNTKLLAVLTLLQTTLSTVLDLLNILDLLTQHCYPDAEQEKVSAELTALTQQQSQQQSPVVTEVNGFTMGVETENTTKSLKRRRAIANNAQGVTMLKGEWSFSSIDQILIDELVFYIQQNNLKAY
jgi:hypothetical protein